MAINPDRWDYDVDVVVVGFGAAGASAALEARQQGASVLVLDRFHGSVALVSSLMRASFSLSSLHQPTAQP